MMLSQESSYICDGWGCFFLFSGPWPLGPRYKLFLFFYYHKNNSCIDKDQRIKRKYIKEKEERYFHRFKTKTSID